MDSSRADAHANPFQDWADEDPELGPIGVSIYDSTRQALTAIPANIGDSVTVAEPILRAMINELNELEADGFMDTIRREEAGDAFAGLAELARVPADVAQEWFDDWRDF